jgi:hypothetical protein
MQRVATRQSPGPSATERKFIAWVKHRGVCAACGQERPLLVHHVLGSSAKTSVGLERVQIGNAYILGLCCQCDSIVTHGSRRGFRELFGPEPELWAKQYESSPVRLPGLTVEGILQWKP